ncbi:vegetative incompatibility het-e-1 [Trichoderma arundinaceum]|uniref:Vegetative incompatibility het-e-1 n=1 Tax=Trichoderma arundinaceum TaxID=490622 RepID=A0A395NWI5_TRIAR|nr:vegetative incompatibility het-e-1 [Trichoderma arundinaceum]
MLELLHDARRFILKYRYIAGTAPLQLYISGLVFAPTSSIIKRLFLEEKPDWISVPEDIEDSWGAQLETLDGHEGGLRSITFSPNGRLLASGAEDKTVNVWDLATGTLRQTFTGYSSPVICVAFSPDTQVLASVSQDGVIKLWDVTAGILQRTTIKHIDDNLRSATFSLDGRLLATQSSGGRTGDPYQTAIWDLNLGIQKYVLGETSHASLPLAFSADGLLLAGVLNDDILLWDSMTGALRQTLKGRSGAVESVAFSPNRQLLASGHSKSAVKLWDAITGMQKHSFTKHGIRKQNYHGWRFGNIVAFSPDGQLLANGYPWGTTLFDLATYRVYKENSNPVRIIAFSPDSKVLGSTYYNDKTIELWDLTVKFLNQEPRSAQIKAIEFSSDGQLVISTWPLVNGIGVWNPSQATLKQRLKKFNFTGYMQDSILQDICKTQIL